MAGINRAKKGGISLSNESRNNSIQKPCIFLSHISIDKEQVKQIANYIMKANIDVYLDIYDYELQRAVQTGDSKKITENIEQGIFESSHIMCIISEKTKSSWWVPYELGYGRKSNKKVASLKLKGNIDLPDFLKIGDIIMGTKSLNEYLEKVVLTCNRNNIYLNESLESHTQSNHPLDSTLDWNQ